jgi:hypothetical protein
MAAAHVYGLSYGNPIGLGMAQSFKKWLEEHPIREGLIGGQQWRLNEPSIYAIY